MSKFDVPYSPPKSSVIPPTDVNAYVFVHQHQQDFANKGLWDNDGNMITNLRSIYVLNEENELEQAKFDPQRLFDNALRGSLFMLDKNSNMRQITLAKENDEWTFNVSVPMELPEDPPRPSRFIRFFAWLVPSWRERVKDYERQVDFNNKLRIFGESEEHPVDFEPNAPRQKAEEIEPEPEQTPVPQKQKTREEILSIQLKPTDPLLSRDEFKNYVNVVYNTYFNEDIQVLEDENPTVEKYLKALARRVETAAIGNLYAALGDFNGRDERKYDDFQKDYWNMKAYLGKYVRQKVDMDKLQDVLKNGFENSPHKKYFNDLHDFMSERYLTGAYADVMNLLKEGKELPQELQIDDWQEEPEQEMNDDLSSEEVSNTEQEEKQPEEQEEKQPEEQEELQEVRPPERMQEFTNDPMIIQNDTIALTNDPKVLQNFKNDPKNNLEDSTVDFLDHRIYRLTTMAENAKNPDKFDRKPVITEKDGVRKVMLDASQPRTQRNGASCWSVSLQTVLNYRGAKIDQEDIRAYRPDGTKQSIEFDLNARVLNADTINSVSNYSTLINQYLPNVVLHSVGFVPGNRPPKSADRIALAREAISRGLEKHNSPVSFVRTNHYCTIVGMEGDTIYYRDPLKTDMQEMSLKDLVSAKDGKLQLFWLQDLEVDLGGNVKDLHGYAGEGVNYSGGVYSNVGEEVTAFNENYVIQEAGREFKTAGCEKSLRMSSNYPATLSYKRNPGQKEGFAYNMDAMDQMRQELQKLSDEGKGRGETGAVYASLDALTKKLEGFVSGKEKIDYEKMYGVAKDYNALVKAAGGDGALGNALGKHLQQVRSAMDAHLHYENRQLGYPKRWPEPQEKQREQLEKGLAGLIAAGNIKNVNNENWLAAYEPKNVVAAKDQIRKTEAFKNMMLQLDKSVNQEKQDDAIAGDKRTSVQLCYGACGGNPRLLLTAFNKELLATNELGMQQEKTSGTVKLAMDGNAPQKTNVNSI